jgi:tRNA(Arg) A34 adenosine deaminase TadA
MLPTDSWGLVLMLMVPLRCSQAETNLVRLSTKSFTGEQLEHSTLYTSTEPCAMCSGAIYWSGIRRVVYAFPEDQLRAITGSNPENLTLNLPCREVFARGQRTVEVSGPHQVDEARAVHDGFWDAHP